MTPQQTQAFNSLMAMTFGYGAACGAAFCIVFSLVRDITFDLWTIARAYLAHRRLRPALQVLKATRTKKQVDFLYALRKHEVGCMCEECMNLLFLHNRLKELGL